MNQHVMLSSYLSTNHSFYDSVNQSINFGSSYVHSFSTHSHMHRDRRVTIETEEAIRLAEEEQLEKERLKLAGMPQHQTHEMHAFSSFMFNYRGTLDS